MRPVSLIGRYSSEKCVGLDRIGRLLARYDEHPCWACRARVLAAIEDYDRL